MNKFRNKSITNQPSYQDPFVQFLTVKKNWSYIQMYSPALDTKTILEKENIHSHSHLLNTSD